jgi:hypothetical protein
MPVDAQSAQARANAQDAAVIKANLVREWLMAELRQSADRWMKAEGASYPEAQADASARNDCGNAIDDLLIECAEREATP